MLKTIELGLAIAFLGACSQQSAPVVETKTNTVQVPITSDPAKAQTVHAYTAAFNARDIDAMLALASDDIEWISLDGKTLVLGADGADNLRMTMGDYFNSCASCRASLKWTKTTDERVVALEEASWDADGERRSQASLSVYEFKGDKIRRVYYYPAE